MIRNHSYLHVQWHSITVLIVKVSALEFPDAYSTGLDKLTSRSGTLFEVRYISICGTQCEFGKLRFNSEELYGRITVLMEVLDIDEQLMLSMQERKTMQIMMTCCEIS